MLCYGCSEKESKYREGNTIKVCKSFAKKIWKVKNDEDLNKPSTRFDGCGLLAVDNSFTDIDSDQLGFIIPSKAFGSFQDFIEKLGIPYYDGIIIDLEDGDSNNCFDNNNYLEVYPITLILLFLGILI